jgi:hypothetical protein
MDLERLGFSIRKLSRYFLYGRRDRNHTTERQRGRRCVPPWQDCFRDDGRRGGKIYQTEIERSYPGRPSTAKLTALKQ